VRADPDAFDLVITRAQLVLPSGVTSATLAVTDGRIAELLAPETEVRAHRVVDATGLVALPGLFDMHVHFREPGQTHKETFETGSSAAAVGGFTAIADMPNTVPPTTTLEPFLAKKDLAARASYVDFALWGGAGTGGHIGELVEAGAAGIKVYLGLETAAGSHTDAPNELVVRDDAALYDILIEAADVRTVVAVHCGNEALRSRVRNHWRGKGFTELRHAVAREPQLHKVEAVSRTLLLAEVAGARVHIVHVPAPALPHIRRAKERGLPVTAEAALPFATLDRIEETRELGFDRYRSVEDAKRLWAAVADGTIDVLATDHAPHTLAEKQAGQHDLLAAPSGYPELDTALPMLLDAVNSGLLRIERLAEAMSRAPARMLGFANKGALEPGYDADIVLVDMARQGEIGRQQFFSKAGWTPFAGRRVIGWPVRTFLRGEEVARDGRLSAERPLGRFLAGGGTSLS
jgi:dihydroorotase